VVSGFENGGLLWKTVLFTLPADNLGAIEQPVLERIQCIDVVHQIRCRRMPETTGVLLSTESRDASDCRKRAGEEFREIVLQSGRESRSHATTRSPRGTGSPPVTNRKKDKQRIRVYLTGGRSTRD